MRSSLRAPQSLRASPPNPTEPAGRFGLVGKAAWCHSVTGSDIMMTSLLLPEAGPWASRFLASGWALGPRQHRPRHEPRGRAGARAQADHAQRTVTPRHCGGKCECGTGSIAGVS